MYTIWISVAVALAVGGGGTLLGWWGWIVGVFLGLLAFAITWVILGRRIQRRLGPAMLQVRRQAEAGMIEPALRSLEDMLPMGKWFPMLTGQLYGQMGILAHHAKQPERAREYLGKAGRRAGEAQALLAVLHYRDGDTKAAHAVLDAATRVNRKHALLHNLSAWLLHKEGRTDAAMARLAKHLKREPSHEISKDNLLRLQNQQKMNMEGFGVEWYALGLERPSQSFVQQQQQAQQAHLNVGRKGFRQPKKQQKQKQKQKKKAKRR